MDLRSLIARIPFLPVGEPPPVVAVLRLTGIIGSLGPLRSGLTLSGLAGDIEKAFKLPRLKSVALVVNSPGGSPVQSALIAKRIRDLATEKKLPVVAFVEDAAASGGYWLACAADEIVADESSIVGSIGVISAGFGFQELLARHGVERRVHTSGPRKSMLDPFLPEDPDDVARLEALQQEVHEAFREMVRRCRGERLKGAEETLFSGEFWTGRQALALGLVDSLGDLRAVMRARYGEKVQLKVVGREPSWLRRRLRIASPGLPAPADVAAGLLAAAEERALWARLGL